jgi:uncharacterized membrane protein YdjX (TVP38/TMEM64 family)
MERTEIRTAAWRLAPLAALAALAAALWWGFGDRLSFETLEREREALLAWRDRNYALAAAAFALAYAAAVAASLPGAVWLTLAGGFLFGTAVATALVVVAATAGAFAIFLAVKAGLGDALRARAGEWMRRFEQGVAENEAGFMLAIRLMPIVPFFVANVAPAFLGVRPRIFLWTTFLGIIPGAAVYASVGAGLGEVFARGERPDIGLIFDWPVLGPLMGLAALALLPSLWRALRRRRAA